MAERQDFAVPDTAPEPAGDKSPFEGGLPASLDSERTILGAVLLDNQSYNAAAEVLEPADFALTAHGTVFTCMGELIDAGIAVDIVTLSEELRRRKALDSVGGVAWIASLTEGLPRRLSIADYVRSVREKSQLRRLISICSTAITRAADQSESPLPILESVEGQLLEIAQESNSGKLKTIVDSIDEAGGIDPYIRSVTDPAEKTGLPTGLIDYDRMTGGLQKQEMTIIAARPSQGKTALAITIALNVTRDSDAVVALFSLEMSRGSLERRMMASEARVNVRRAMMGEWLSQTERDKIAAAVAGLVEQRIFVDDSSTLTPTQMRAKCRRVKQRVGRLDLVIVDYIGLMTASGKHSNRQEEVGSISRAMKACARELDCPVIALAQLNRKSEERTDKRPILSDLRDSGNIEADADVVSLIHRESYYRPDDPDVEGMADIVLAKQRQGPTGVIKLAYMADFTLFDNLARM